MKGKCNVGLGKGYKMFAGNPLKKMPSLLKEGYAPLSIAGIMKARIENGSKFSQWWKQDYNTIDGYAFNTEGEGKIVLDSEDIKNLNSKTNLYNGGIILKDNEFEELTGKKVLYLSKEKLEKMHKEEFYMGRDIEQIIDCEVLNFLTRENKLLCNYAEAVAEEGGDYKIIGLVFPFSDWNNRLNVWSIGSISNSSETFASRSLGYHTDSCGMEYNDQFATFIGFKK